MAFDVDGLKQGIFSPQTHTDTHGHYMHRFANGYRPLGFCPLDISLARFARGAENTEFLLLAAGIQLFSMIEHSHASLYNTCCAIVIIRDFVPIYSIVKSKLETRLNLSSPLLAARDKFKLQINLSHRSDEVAFYKIVEHDFISHCSRSIKEKNMIFLCELCVLCEI